MTNKQNEDQAASELVPPRLSYADTDLQIHYAHYGSELHKRSVISWIEGKVSLHCRLNLLVNSANLGGDHYPGKAKQLHIIYTFNGVLCEEVLDEGEMLVIPKLQVTEVKEAKKVDMTFLALGAIMGWAGGLIITPILYIMLIKLFDKLYDIN